MTYYDYLVDQIDGEEKRGRKFSKILHKMLEVPFLDLVGNDSNRVEDGLIFRRNYELETGEHSGYLHSVSVFEVLLGLADRMNFELDEADMHLDQTAELFWELVDNLGLLGYDDEIYNENEVEKRLEKFVTRDYEPDGRGGCFPIFNPKNDQRDVELWYQMQAYINEKYVL